MENLSFWLSRTLCGRVGQYAKTHSMAKGIILLMYGTVLHSMLRSIHPGNYFLVAMELVHDERENAPSCKTICAIDGF